MGVHTGSGVVSAQIHLLILALYKLCLFNFIPYFLLSLYFLPYLFTVLPFLVYFLTYLSPPCGIDPLRFQAGGRRRRPNLVLVIWFVLCCSIFCYRCMCAFAVSDLVFQY